MTLIAAVRHFGVPVLFADSLVTGGPHETATQKIYRIRPDFVVGVTGHLTAAEFLIPRLIEAATQPVNFQRLRAMLLSFAGGLEDYEVELVGWFCDPEPVSFHWKRDEPSHVRLGDQFARGSGADRYVRVIGDGFLGTTSEREPHRSAEDAILSEMVLLMEDEVGLRRNRNARFGHSYEALYLSPSGSFDFLGDSLFGFVDALFDETGKCISCNLFPEMFILRRVDGVSFTERYVIVQNAPSREEMTVASFNAVLTQRDVDVAIRKVVGWTVAERLAVQHVCLNVALIKRRNDGLKVIAKVPFSCANWDRANSTHVGVWAEMKSVPDEGHTLVARLPPVDVLEFAYRTISNDIARSSQFDRLIARQSSDLAEPHHD
jgi:hypothetical protein